MSETARYIERIKILDRASEDAALFQKQLKQQEWIVSAARDTSPNNAITAHLDRLALLLQAPDTSPETIRAAARGLISAWQENPRSEKRDALTLAGWTSLAAAASAILAIVIGDQGLVRFFQTLQPPAPPPAPPPATPATPIIEAVIALLHVGAIGLFLLLSSFGFADPREKQEYGSKPAKQSFEQFKKGWIGIWISWALLYVWLLVCWGTRWHADHPLLTWSVADAVNMINGFLFFHCFLVLDMPSVNTGEEPGRAAKFNRSRAFVFAVGVAFVILSVAGRTGLVPSLKTAGPLMAACYNGLAMAYLFGRLDTHIMRVPRLLLVPLYLYVMIQLTWFTFSDEPSRVYPLGAALILKIAVFFLISDWIRDGSFSRYFVDAEKLYREREAELATKTG